MRMITANLMSNIMIDGTAMKQPEIGMAATLSYYTDREAATIIAVWVKNGKQFITVQEDKATRTDNYGMSDIQEYEYERDPNGCKYTYRFNTKKVLWERVVQNPETGRWVKSESPHLILGRRCKYYDYSF